MVCTAVEESIRAMTEKALEQVEEGYLVGLGSGSTVAHFVEALGRRALEGGWRLSVIPSSLQIQLVAEKLGLQILMPPTIPLIDLVVDGFDQVDKNFNMIKGYGGALLKEKILMSSARKRVLLADERKFVENLDKPFPVEVVPFGRLLVAERLRAMGGRPELRTLEKGYPYFTENGNLIINADFGGIEDPKRLEAEVKAIPGVVEVGIFTIRADLFYKAKLDGTVQVLRP